MGSLPFIGNFSLFFCFIFIFFSASSASFNLSTISFDDGYTHLFGEGNLVRSGDGRSVSLLLDVYTGEFHRRIFSSKKKKKSKKNSSELYFNSCEFSGAGFISSNLYNHGFFSANIKLPSEYTAGVVVAFYVR